jgi:phospholipid transport system substrate-binding protein
MMRRLTVLLGIVLAGAWIAGPLPARADLAGDAGAFISSHGKQLLDILGEAAGEGRRNDFRAWLDQSFDLQTIAKLALGPYRSTATPDQLSAYEQAFADYIVVTYEARFNAFSGYSFSVGQSRQVNDADAVVRATVTDPSGKPTALDFRVRNNGGKLQVLDVAVEGISMLKTQRDEFASVIQQSGIDGLTKALKDRTAQVEAGGG